MNDFDFEVTKEGTTLNIVLGKKLTVQNAPALTDELSKYRGQDIVKVEFNATGLMFLTSAGLRVVLFAYQILGRSPEIVFVNCAKEIYQVFEHVGLTSSIKFEESSEKRAQYRINMLCELDHGEIEQYVSERKKSLEDFSANNDVVCYNLRMGQQDE